MEPLGGYMIICGVVISAEPEYWCLFRPAPIWEFPKIGDPDIVP